MNTACELKRAGRSLGIVAVFGPIALSIFLAFPAVVAVSLCWLATRKLHRTLS